MRLSARAALKRFELTATSFPGPSGPARRSKRPRSASAQTTLAALTALDSPLRRLGLLDLGLLVVAAFVSRIRCSPSPDLEMDDEVGLVVVRFTPLSR